MRGAVVADAVTLIVPVPVRVTTIGPIALPAGEVTVKVVPIPLVMCPAISQLPVAPVLVSSVVALPPPLVLLGSLVFAPVQLLIFATISFLRFV